MEQVEEICKNIVLINKGKLVIDGDVKEIRTKFKQNIYKLSFSNLPIIPANDLFDIITTTGDTMSMKLKSNQSGNELLQYFIQTGAEITSFNEILPSLTEIFIQLVKEKNHEQNLAHN
jgi:ABC-2 type transport system ATP-binding protein